MNLTEIIRRAVVCQRDSAGEIQLRRVKGSSISLPLVDEQKTRTNIECLMAELLQEMPVESALAAVKESVSNLKSLYMQTHDGFRLAKGTGKGHSVTIANLYSFAVAASYCFDSLPVAGRNSGMRIGIGVMAPAAQDCGKNLIKLVWKAAGLEVVDFGNRLTPAVWMDWISRGEFSAVGISCMVNRCIDNVRRLLALLTEGSIRLPVILGGIAVNRVIAFNLAQGFGLPIYYGQDLAG